MANNDKNTDEIWKEIVLNMPKNGHVFSKEAITFSIAAYTKKNREIIILHRNLKLQIEVISQEQR
jgi:hypothetical protein